MIGRIHGPAIGGGTGLVAVCDIAIAADDAVFAFTETKLGPHPGGDLALPAAAHGRAEPARVLPDRRALLRGPRGRAGAGERARCRRPSWTRRSRRRSRACSPADRRRSRCPRSSSAGIGERSLEENGTYTAEVIARLRMSDEGQEGMNAFLEKRKPRGAVE